MTNLKNTRLHGVLFLSFLILFGAVGCGRKYSITTSKVKRYVEHRDFKIYIIDGAKPDQRIWQVKNPALEGDVLTGHFETASPEIAYLIHSNTGKGSELNDHKQSIFCYAEAAIAKSIVDNQTGSIHLAQIDSTKIVQFSKGGAAGIAILSVIVVAGIVLFIACNCPYVYTDTPDGPYLEGALYSGAVYPQLERHDWLALQQLQPADGQYKLRLANELAETQHTNLLQLEAIDHEPGVTPLFDKHGRLYTLSAPQTPVLATDGSGYDVLPQVSGSDGFVYQGDEENNRPDAVESLTLTFAKPTTTADTAKLMVRAKNSAWMNAVYYGFQDEMGVYAEKARHKFAKKSADFNLAWMERQKMPLAVWMETAPGKWEKIDYFHVAGSASLQNDVMPLDVSQVQTDSIRLRLEFGFRFWEIDQVALDFSPEKPVQRQTLKPSSVLNQAGEDMTQALSIDDHLYYDQQQTTDEAVVTFAAPVPEAGLERSLVLHAKGHYEIHHQPSGNRPSYREMKSWEKENALPKYSRSLWQATQAVTLETGKK